MKDWLKKNRRQVLRWAGTILSLLLLVWVFYSNREDIALALKNASQPETLVKVLIAAGLIVLSRLCTVARWHTLLRAGGIPIPFKETLRLTFAGLFGSNFLPTSVGGDVVRLAGAMQMGYDRAVCLASIAVDRLVNMAGMSLAAPLVWIPHSYNGCKQHGPNEHFLIAPAREGITAYAGIWWDLGEPGSPTAAS